MEEKPCLQNLVALNLNVICYRSYPKHIDFKWIHGIIVSLSIWSVCCFGVYIEDPIHKYIMGGAG